jgi:uncharacterized protein YjcR
MASVEGELNGHAILTGAEVGEIKALYLTGENSYTDIARRFGVRKSTVQSIINTDRWDHSLEPGQAEELARVRELRRNNHKLKHKRKGYDHVSRS